MKTAAIAGINVTTGSDITGQADTGGRVLRRVGAVFAGLVAIFAMSTGTDVVLHLTGIFPPMGQRMSDGLFVLAATYRAVHGVLGCYLTARLAPDRPLAHALVLGSIGVVISIAGAIAMGDRGPAWYALAIIAISPPCAFIGGKWREAELRARAA